MQPPLLVLNLRLTVPFLELCCLVLSFAGLVALVVGIPTLRLKGDYLAVATLGVAEIIRILIVNGGSLTNGAAGILGIPNFTNWQWYISLL